MADTKRTEVYDVDINRFYDTIVDYESYSDFIDGVDRVEVNERSETKARVTYFLNLIKEFSYTLKMEHKRPNRVSWTLESGDLFKTNTGYWELKDLGKGKTEVTYALDISFKLMVPKMVLNSLAGKNLPKMMDAVYERARAH